MAGGIQDIIESLQNFDTDQLNDLNAVGSWPMAVKVIIWTIVFAGALAAGYFVHITNLQSELAATQKQEVKLRQEFEDKFFEAAHLDGYRSQQKQMEESFEAILRQLPGDTEIPGLIEDITLVGLKNGLSFQSIDLKPEVKHEFYVEKPIQINVTGSYHDLGSFVSDVADLSRIVTLHDFEIEPAGGGRGGRGKQETGGLLTMNILAKTYRYNDERS
ncbi:MAG: type IV pilus assembly protein PilO [Candidatus Azotimanducaceae bacterium]|jgi:type IV pilus assembly protein PilO